jgi:hypothetical protein
MAPVDVRRDDERDRILAVKNDMLRRKAASSTCFGSIAAAELRILAERRLGEMLKVTPKNEGGNLDTLRNVSTSSRSEPVDKPPTLSSLGISLGIPFRLGNWLTNFSLGRCHTLCMTVMANAPNVRLRHLSSSSKTPARSS